ncbi:MAG: hypothetical protein ABR572_10520 [Cryomorphaceae bacterium]|nr:hypothetical protein [Flavobacteriales bacterium]
MKMLFNPFERYAGIQALTAGVVIAVLAALGASFFQTRFDGVLDAHYNSGDVEFVTAISDQLINASCAFIIFYALSVILGARGLRPIDMLGTLMLARAPYVLMPLGNVGGYMSAHGEAVMKSIESDPLNPDLGPILAMLPVILLSIVLVAWMIALFFNAWKVCTNFKGVRLIGGFIAALFLAEVLSKLVLALI